MDIETLWHKDLKAQQDQPEPALPLKFDQDAGNILPRIRRAFRLEILASALGSFLLILAFWAFSEERSLLLWVALPIFIFIVGFYCVIAHAIKHLPTHDPSAPYVVFLSDAMAQLKRIKLIYRRVGTWSFPSFMILVTSVLSLAGFLDLANAWPKLLAMLIFFSSANAWVVSLAFNFLYDRHIQDLQHRLEEWESFTK